MEKIIKSLAFGFIGLAIFTGWISYSVGKKTFGGFQNGGFQQAQPFIVTTGNTNAATTTKWFGDILPLVNNLYNLGSTSTAWGNIFASSVTSSGSGVFNTLRVTSSTNAILVGDGTGASPAIAAISDPKTGLNFASSNITLSNTGSANYVFTGSGFVFGQQIRPSANNSIDIGTPALSIQNEYASGTIFAPTLKPVGTNPGIVWQDRASVVSASMHQSANLLEWGTQNVSDWWIMALNGANQGAMYPATSTVDLGKVGSEVRSIFATGTAVLPYISSSGTATFASVVATSVTTTALAVTGLAAFKGGGGISVTSTGQVFMNGLTSSTVAGLRNLCQNATTGEIDDNSGVTGCFNSSARFKEHITSLSPTELLNEVMKLRAVSFDYRQDKPFAGTVGANGRHSAGLIAEEVALIDPMLVGYTSSYTPDELAWEKKNYPKAILIDNGTVYIPQAVDYARVAYVTVGAIQYQQAEIDELKSQVNKQQGFMDWLIARLKQMFK